MARHTAKAIHSGSPQSSSVRHTEYAMSRTTYGGAGARSRHTAAAMSRAGRPLAASPGVPPRYQRRNLTGRPFTR
jgi:hypothetical protein